MEQLNYDHRHLIVIVEQCALWNGLIIVALILRIGYMRTMYEYIRMIVIVNENIRIPLCDSPFVICSFVVGFFFFVCADRGLSVAAWSTNKIFSLSRCFDYKPETWKGVRVVIQWRHSWEGGGCRVTNEMSGYTDSHLVEKK